MEVIKKAFSLIELMMVIILSAVVLAAFAPLMTKKLNTTNVIFAKNSGASLFETVTPSNPEVPLDCSLIHGAGCSSCDLLQCKACSSSYTFVDGICKKCTDSTRGCISCNQSNICSKCEPGFALVQSGLRKICEPCSAGRYSSGYTSSCSLCPIDTYSTLPAGSACTSCPYGTFSDKTGSTECIPCANKWEGCVACTTEGGCSYCESGYTLSNGACYCNTVSFDKNWYSNIAAIYSKDKISSISVISQYSDSSYSRKININSDVVALVYNIGPITGGIDIIITGAKYCSGLKIEGDFSGYNSASEFPPTLEQLNESGGGTAFTGFTNIKKIYFYDGFDTSGLTNTAHMFSLSGIDSTSFSIEGLNNWNTSKITNMRGMFGNDHYHDLKTTDWNIGDLSYKCVDRNLDGACEYYAWNTSMVSDMTNMFRYAGSGATDFTLGNLSDWKVSSVNSFRNMFMGAGEFSDKWYIGDLANWQPSGGRYFDGMFYLAASRAEEFILNVGSWGPYMYVAENLSYMFYSAGRLATTWNIGDMDLWASSLLHVYDASYMFAYAGQHANKIVLSPVNFKFWRSSSNNNFEYATIDRMFWYFGSNSSTFTYNLSLVGWCVDISAICEGMNLIYVTY